VKKTSIYSANVPKRTTGSKPKPLPAIINGRLYKEVAPTATASKHVKAQKRKKKERGMICLGTSRVLGAK
jgi:hypothetical protein